MAFTPQRCCRPVEGEVLPYLPTISCPTLSCCVKAASHKPFNLPPVPSFGPAMLEGVRPYKKSSYEVRSGPPWGLPISSYCYELLYGWRNPPVPPPGCARRGGGSAERDAVLFALPFSTDSTSRRDCRVASVPRLD